MGATKLRPVFELVSLGVEKPNVILTGIAEVFVTGIDEFDCSAMDRELAISFAALIPSQISH